MELREFANNDVAAVEREMRAIISAEPREVYGPLEEYIFRGGKRMRPALLMLCFRALGGKDRTLAFRVALKVAALIELFHNFTLVHDDIEDDSEFRRGKPTLHISHGIPIALNCGDALYTLVWNNLVALDAPPEKRIKIASILGRAFQRVVEGQGIELEWYRKRKTAVSEEEYFRMASGKTGALMGASCAAGAYLAGASPQEVDDFEAFGDSLGLAFQIQDDVLNLAGEFRKYKKEIGGDITEGKRSLMAIHAMAHAAPQEARRLSQILLAHMRDKKKIDYAISLMKKYDSVNYAKLRAREFVEGASAFLARLPPSKEVDALKAFSEYAITREL